MTPLTTVDVALIAAILGPAFSVITVIVTNWSLTRREQKRWQQEQAFEREKWERQHEEERQQDLQAKLLDTYSNCISALTAVTAIKAFDTSQEKWLSDLPKDLYRGCINKIVHLVAMSARKWHGHSISGLPRNFQRNHRAFEQCYDRLSAQQRASAALRSAGGAKSAARRC